jgi:putative holliday junction resolvase
MPEAAPVRPSSMTGAAPSGHTITALGFDFGTRRIGVAVGNGLTGSAQPLEVVSNGDRGPDWNRIGVLIRDWRPQVLLVGLPLTLDGAEQRNSTAAREFSTTLVQRYGLPAHLVDERLSSVEAARRFAELRARGAARRKDAQNLDAVAAQVIVETWLMHNPRRPDQ